MLENKTYKAYLGALIIFSLILFGSCSSDISDPVFATGKIYAGSQNTYQYEGGGESKGDTEIKYVYQTKSGKTYNTTQSINKEAFDQVYKGQYIQIVYSEAEPHKSIPLVDEATVNKYVKQDSRHIDLTDLYELINIDSSKEMESALNEISFKWSYQKDDSTDLWYNLPFNETIYRSEKETIGYMTRSRNMFMRMRSKMKKAGFEEMINLGQGHQIWRNDTHMAESSVRIEQEGYGRQAKTVTYFAISFIENSSTSQEE